MDDASAARAVPGSAPVTAAPRADDAREDGLPITVDVLLLDMDGTLVDSGDAVERSWNRGLADLGTDATFTHDFHGIPARQVLRMILPDASDAQIEDAFAHIEDIEARDTDSIRVLPGTARLLDELEGIERELGRPAWTIVTSCTRRLFGARWATTGLPEPASIVTADQVERGKPDPAPYLLGMERLGFSGADALVIEDSAGGLASGRAAGARTLAVTTTTPRESLVDSADAVVGTLDDIALRVVDGRIEVRLRDG